MSRRHCLAMDLKDDPDLIAEYDRYHRAVWPEVKQSLQDVGVEDMEIYRTGNRLFMIMEVSDGFSFEAKAEADLANPRVVEWEDLMGTLQQPLPWVGPGGPGARWARMERVFKLAEE